MTEISCAISAASQIAPLCDYADLDGSHLIAKNLFEEIILSNGKIKLQKKSEIAVERNQFAIPDNFNC
jgi:hypothetical protein